MPSIDRLFDELLTRGASDLHLSIDYPPMTRVRGDLVPLGTEVLKPAAMNDLLFPLLTPPQNEKFTREKDLDFALAFAKDVGFEIKGTETVRQLIRAGLTSR